MTVIPAASTERRTQPLIAVSYETLAYLAVFMLAVIFRGISLGTVPLGEVEAQQALAAYQLYHPEAPTIGTIHNPVTYAGMILTIGIMGATDTAARILPMLAGLTLVFTPLLFKHQIGRVPALIASALLAISPTAVGTSHLVSGITFAVLGVVIALAALIHYWQTRQVHLLVMMGIALGVALSADMTTLLSLLALTLAITFAVLTDTNEELEESESNLRTQIAETPLRVPIISMLATILIIGTAFFFVPEGLGAAADQLGRFFQGIITRPSNSTWVGLSLVLYEPIILILGLAGIWLSSQSERMWERILAGWSFASLILILIYQGSQAWHGLWVIIPLTGLVAITISRLLTMEVDSPRWVSWGQAAAVVAFCGIMFATLSQYLESPRRFAFTPDSIPAQIASIVPLDVILIIIWLMLMIILWLTVAGMWEPRTAWRGLGLGLVALSILINLGGSGGLAFTRSQSAYEPLNQIPSQAGLSVMLGTLNDLGELAVGSAVDPSITVQGRPTGSLAWALRNYSDVTYVNTADPTVSTDIVITPADGADPALGSVYVGQDFVIIRQWSPAGLPASEFIKWLFYHTAPTPASEQRVILWVREDIYRLAPASGLP